MKGKQRVAIFDVDGTIFRSSLLIELVETLIEEKVFPENTRKIYTKEYRLWLERRGDYESYISAVVSAFMKNIKGVSYADFMRVSGMVVEKQQGKVYRYTRDILEEFKKKGYFLLAISQSPKSILDLFCDNLGFDKVYGRIYETDGDGRFTGNITDLDLIANKANIVKRAAERNNLSLEDSIAIGDTEGDIPMLEQVAHPICFNPNEKLFKTARQKGWKIIVERKDMIYEID